MQIIAYWNSKEFSPAHKPGPGCIWRWTITAKM